MEPVLGFIGGIGPTEMLIVGIIALLLFGKRLPAMANSLGQSVNAFKRGLNDVKTSITSDA
ncbi:MAG TPA: twin-arginine translocase TatA/TatE family subunit [Planctomycetaceae bacterium]|nr:twin-arginine translocase TatA/TatE family subunit [Planctomycetaceae bacterium]